MVRIYTSIGSLCEFPSASTQKDTLKTAVEIKAIKFQGFQRPGSPLALDELRRLLPGKLV